MEEPEKELQDEESSGWGVLTKVVLVHPFFIFLSLGIIGEISHAETPVEISTFETHSSVRFSFPGQYEVIEAKGFVKVLLKNSKVFSGAGSIQPVDECKGRELCRIKMIQAKKIGGDEEISIYLNQGDQEDGLYQFFDYRVANSDLVTIDIWRTNSEGKKAAALAPVKIKTENKSKHSDKNPVPEVKIVSRENGNIPHYFGKYAYSVRLPKAIREIDPPALDLIFQKSPGKTDADIHFNLVLKLIDQGKLGLAYRTLELYRKKYAGQLTEQSEYIGPYIQMKIAERVSNKSLRQIASLSFRSALEKFPNSTLSNGAKLYLAKLAFENKEYVKSIDLYQGFLNQNRKHPLAQNMTYILAEAYYHLERYTSAMPLFQSVANTLCEKEYCYLSAFRVGDCYISLGKQKQAFDAWTLAQKLYKQNLPIDSLMMKEEYWYSLRDQKNYDLDYKQLKDHFGSNPEIGYAGIKYADLLLEKGNVQEALATLKEIDFKYRNNISGQLAALYAYSLEYPMASPQRRLILKDESDKIFSVLKDNEAVRKSALVIYGRTLLQAADLDGFLKNWSTVGFSLTTTDIELRAIFARDRAFHDLIMAKLMDKPKKCIEILANIAGTEIFGQTMGHRWRYSQCLRALALSRLAMEQLSHIKIHESIINPFDPMIPKLDVDFAMIENALDLDNVDFAKMKIKDIPVSIEKNEAVLRIGYKDREYLAQNDLESLPSKDLMEAWIRKKNDYLYEAKMYEPYVRSLQKWSETAPNTDKDNIREANSLIKLARWSEAEKVVKRLTDSSDPSVQGTGRFFQALCYRGVGNSAKAVENLRELDLSKIVEEVKEDASLVLKMMKWELANAPMIKSPEPKGLGLPMNKEVPWN